MAVNVRYAIYINATGILPGFYITLLMIRSAFGIFPTMLIILYLSACAEWLT
jgi:hypothetical protein